MVRQTTWLCTVVLAAIGTGETLHPGSLIGPPCTATALSVFQLDDASFLSTAGSSSIVLLSQQRNMTAQTRVISPLDNYTTTLQASYVPYPIQAIGSDLMTLALSQRSLLLINLTSQNGRHLISSTFLDHDDDKPTTLTADNDNVMCIASQTELVIMGKKSSIASRRPVCNTLSALAAPASDSLWAFYACRSELWQAFALDATRIDQRLKTTFSSAVVGLLHMDTNTLIVADAAGGYAALDLLSDRVLEQHVNQPWKGAGAVRMVLSETGVVTCFNTTLSVYYRNHTLAAHYLLSGACLDMQVVRGVYLYVLLASQELLHLSVPDLLASNCLPAYIDPFATTSPTTTTTTHLTTSPASSSSLSEAPTPPG